MDTKHNQHVLPKLYLKGFVIKKDEPFIWVYQKGQQYDPGSDRYNRVSQASKIYFSQNQDWVVTMLNKGNYGWRPIFSPKSVYTVAELVKDSPDSEPYLKINV